MDPVQARPAKRPKTGFRDREQFVCGQCCREMDTFSEPQLVNCLHSICSACSKNLQQGSKCNLCQSVIDRKMVKPDLFFHNRILEQYENLETNQTGSGDEIVSQSTKQINRGSKCACCTDVSLALFSCDVCRGPICESCRNDHGIMKELKWHNIEKRNVAKEKSLDILKPVICCKIHEEIFDRYCERCKELMCPSCSKEQHSEHHHSLLYDENCSLNKANRAAYQDSLTAIRTKTNAIESTLDSYSSSFTLLDDVYQRQKTVIDCFQTKMKQFVDEVAKYASEKLKLKCDHKRIQLKKEREQLQFVHRKVSHLNSFMEDVADQNFVVGMAKAKTYLNSAIDDQMIQVTPNIFPPDPSFCSIPTPEFFDGKLIVENFFTFLRTHVESDECIRLFRRYTHERFSRGNTSSPTKPPQLRSIASVEIQSPDKKSATQQNSPIKPPVPIFTNSINYLIPDPRLRQTQGSPSCASLITKPTEKALKTEIKVNPIGHSTNLATCCVCLAQSNRQSGQVCIHCSSFYHSTCHTPIVERHCTNWTCIRCTMHRFSNVAKITDRALNVVQKLVCARILVTIVVKVNDSSLKSPFGTPSCSSDFNHIKERLFPPQGRYVSYETVFDFHSDVRAVLDGYRRFNQSVDSAHNARQAMDEIDTFVRDIFELEFLDFHQNLFEYREKKSNIVSDNSLMATSRNGQARQQVGAPSKVVRIE